MATNVPSLEEWERSVNARFTSRDVNEWIGFVPFRAYEDHFSENHANFATAFSAGAVPLAAGLYVSHLLASSHASRSRPVKCLNLLGLSVLGLSSTVSLAWTVCVGISAFSRGRVLALNTKNSRCYVMSTWSKEGHLLWSTHRYDTNDGSAQ